MEWAKVVSPRSPQVSPCPILAERPIKEVPTDQEIPSQPWDPEWAPLIFKPERAAVSRECHQTLHWDRSGSHALLEVLAGEQCRLPLFVGPAFYMFEPFWGSPLHTMKKFTL